MLNKQTFEKRIQQTNNSIYFKFIGTEKNKNIDYKQINNLIEKCFNNITQLDNIIKIVSWIRTILKDFEENYLEVEIIQSIDSKEKAIYINKILDVYNKSTPEKMIFDYKSNNKLNISLDIKNLNLSDYYNYLNQNELINNSMGILYCLSNVEQVKLTSDDEVICLLYKTFYDELPDFSNKDKKKKFK